MTMDQPRSGSKAATGYALFLQSISTAAMIAIVVILALIFVELQKIKNGEASVGVYLPDNVHVLIEGTALVAQPDDSSFLVRNLS